MSQQNVGKPCPAQAKDSPIGRDLEENLTHIPSGVWRPLEHGSVTSMWSFQDGLSHHSKLTWHFMTRLLEMMFKINSIVLHKGIVPFLLDCSSWSPSHGSSHLPTRYPLCSPLLAIVILSLFPISVERHLAIQVRNLCIHKNSFFLFIISHPTNSQVPSNIPCRCSQTCPLSWSSCHYPNSGHHYVLLRW